jgi:hypothetical protein
VKTQLIQTFFEGYASAFRTYNLEAAAACYSIPCTLHTPDKVVLVNSIDDCRQEINDIFSQLKLANIARVVVKNSSFMAINDNLLLACINWDFIDEREQIFADFCAYYHLSVSNSTEHKLAIVNVVSHELSNSLSLTNLFTISE